MDNFIGAKKGTILLFLVSALGIGVYYLLMISSELSMETVVGVLKPFAVLSIAGLIFSSFFFIFPEELFKQWLRKIAWWYMLVLLVVTASTPVLSSNILSLDRSQVVFGGMFLLFVITALFVFATRKGTDAKM